MNRKPPKLKPGTMDIAEMQRVLTELVQYVQELDRDYYLRNNEAITTTNVTSTSSLDVSTATLTNVANFAATLAESLKSAKLLK